MKKYKSSFYKSVMTVASGTMIAQIITLISSPFLTRIYGAEEYGTLGIFLSFTMILVPIGALQLPTAIVLPKNDKEIYPIIRYSILISFLNALILTFLLVCFGQLLIDRFDFKISEKLLFLLPVYIIFSVFFDIMKQLAIRKEKFGVKAYVDVQQSIIYNVGNLILGLLHPFAISLIFMSVLNRFLHSFTMFIKLKKSSTKLLFYNIINENKDFKTFIKKYYDFILYRSPQVLLNGLSEAMPTFLLGLYFGPAVAGFYIISKKTLEAPIILIGNAIGDVFYPRINKAFNEGANTFDLLLKSNVLLAIIGCIPFSILFIFSPYIFGVIFGEDWYMSGIYTRWLSIFLFFFFITRTTIKVMPVYRIQRFHLNFTIVSTLFRVLALIYGAQILKDDIMTIKIYSIVGAILYFYLLIHTLAISKYKTRRAKWN